MATNSKAKDDDNEVDPEVASRRAMGKTDHAPAPGADNTPDVDEAPPPAPGSDRDSLTRLRKTEEAAARSRGDEVAEAGERRAGAGESRLSGPTGRTASAPNKGKASE